MRADRIRAVEISDVVMVRALGPHPMRSLESDWPADAQVVGCDWDSGRRVIRMYLTSATFDEVPQGAYPPLWDPMFTETRMAPQIIDMIEAFKASERT